MSRGMPVVLMRPDNIELPLTAFPITPAPLQYGPVAGVISALNQQLALNCPGASSIVILVKGTFNGTLTLTSSIDDTFANAQGKALYKSAVGSTEKSTITSDGSAAIVREFRAICSGTTVYLTSTAWTSGSVTVQILATNATEVVKVDGPVHTSEESAVRAQRAFQASTGVVAITAGNYLNAVFANPANSGVNMIIERRAFFSNAAGGTTPMEYIQFNDTTTVPTTASPTANRYVGGPASLATLRQQVAGTTLAGAQVSGGIIPTGGADLVLDRMIILPPAHSIGYSIGGSGGGLAAAARFAIAFAWTEETIY